MRPFFEVKSLKKMQNQDNHEIRQNKYFGKVYKFGFRLFKRIINDRYALKIL